MMLVDGIDFRSISGMRSLWTVRVSSSHLFPGSARRASASAIMADAATLSTGRAAFRGREYNCVLKGFRITVSHKRRPHDQTIPHRNTVLFASILTEPGMGRVQTFKVEKFDIKGDGGTDYVVVESATGRVFVSRGTHMMVVEGATGKVLGYIPNTPGVHGRRYRHQGGPRLYN